MKKGFNYTDIYEYDIKLYDFIMKEYVDAGEDEEIAWRLFVASYIDPDGYSGKGVKRAGEIVLTSDALLSIRRIRTMEGFGEKFIETFTKYRKTPVIYFPGENRGINQLRAGLLEDRIDHTLLDIKHYCEGRKGCILQAAYERPKTQKWLIQYKNNFKLLAESMGIVGAFVNENAEVYDLEKSNGEVLKNLKEKYSKPRENKYLESWSSAYYNNVKAKIDLIISKTTK